MTFQEALKQLREDGGTTSWSVPMAAMAEQIEANRLAIEELRKNLAWKADADVRGHGY